MALKNTGPEIVEWDPEFLVRRGNYVALVTPELASELLERNTNNRRPKENAIRKYARDMSAGKWDVDASDIKFARTGELVDGQNRLLACVRANVPFPTMVRTGLSLDTKVHVDTGVARSLADALKMSGKAGLYSSTVGAAVGLRIRYEEVLKAGGNKRDLDTYRRPVSHEEALEFLDRFPEVDEFAVKAHAVRIIVPSIVPSAILAALSMAATADHKAAHKWAEEIINMEYAPGDPTTSLIAYAASVLRLPPGSPGLKGRANAASHLLAMVRVWNARRTSEDFDRRIHIKSIDRLVPVA